MSAQQNFKNAIISKLGVTPDVYTKAEKLAQSNNILILHALIRLRAADTKHLLAFYANINQIRVANLDEMDIPADILKLVPNDIARKARIIPLDRVGNNLIIASEDPLNLKINDLIRFKTGFFIKSVLATEEQLEKALERYYKFAHVEIDKLSTNKVTKAKRKEEKRAVIGKNLGDQSSNVIQVVDQILTQCLARGASDVHIEPYENFLRVRLRIDGVLHEIARPSSSFAAHLISRIKIMAGLNIAEKRLPQDGNIHVTIAEKPIDFRVNTLPTLHGEKIVLRILDKSSLQVDLTRLGFERNDLEKFKDSIYQPFGMVLVTGPTGSGKTTTLYSALSDLNDGKENIMTAEDPVEYTLEGINQVHINNEIGLTFASALRAFLRQDPDIIMVGEIRDFETGEIAIKASLTGHLVLSTLHTNTAADTIVRLQNMGLESFNLISALNCIIAQRLCRRLCEKCKIIDPSPKIELLESLGFDKDFKPKKANGCEQCGQTGYKGRIAIHEVMTMDDELRQAIMDGSSAVALKKIAMRNGMRSMRQNALIKVSRGEIDIAEALSTTSSDTQSVKTDTNVA